MDITDLPQITVIENDGNLYSLNNRRLFVLKALRQAGRLTNNKVQARIKPALGREKERYTVERCSLIATMMREHVAGADDVDVDNEEGEREGEGRECEPMGLQTELNSASKVSVDGILIAPDAQEADKPSPPTGSSQEVFLESSMDELLITPSKARQSKVKAAKVSKGAGAAGAGASVGVSTTPQVSVKTINPVVLQGLRSLTKMVEDGKSKKAMEKVQTWLQTSVISEEEKQWVCREIGLS